MLMTLDTLEYIQRSLVGIHSDTQRKVRVIDGDLLR